MSEGIVLDDGSYVSLVWPPCSPPFMVGDTLVLILPGMNNSSETGERLTKRAEAERRTHSELRGSVRGCGAQER